MHVLLLLLCLDMGEAIEQLDSELAVNSEELQRIQHYKVVALLFTAVCMYICCLIECGNDKKQF